MNGSTETCPKCQSTATYREGGKATDLKTGRRNVAAYWNVCTVCWHKWDGVTDGPGRLPAGVASRATAQENYLMNRGWVRGSWHSRTSGLWRDTAGREMTLIAAVALQRERDV